jgi:hypothetical protein
MNRPLGCFSEQLLKVLKLKTDSVEYRLTVLCPCSQVDKRYSQIVRARFPHLTCWGCQKKKGGGGWRFLGVKDKPNTDGQPYLTIPYTN